METIYNYTDYRTFLKDWFESEKSEKKYFSMSAWARELQMSNPAVLANIIKGHKNMGSSSLEKFIKFFDFYDTEEEYFRNLVKLYEVRDDPTLTLALREKLSRMQKEHIDEVIHFLSDEELNALSSWYYCAIRQMVALVDFKEDYEWIAANLQFDVTPEEVEQAIIHLLDLGLIVRNKEGELATSDVYLKNYGKASAESSRRYTEQMIQNAKNAVRTIPKDERPLKGLTLTIDEKKLPEARQLINDFTQKFSDLYTEKHGNQVYQFNVQLFPLTKKRG